MLSFIYQDVKCLIFAFFHQETSKCINECCDVGTLCSSQFFYLSLQISSKLSFPFVGLEITFFLIFYLNLPIKFSCSTSGIDPIHALVPCKSFLFIITFIVICCIHIHIRSMTPKILSVI